MTGFVVEFNRLSPLNAAAAEDLEACLKRKTFAKGSLLLKQHDICNKLYFLDAGLVKTYFHSEHKEFIMRFFHENSFFTVLDSFTAQIPSHFNITALESTEVTFLTHIDLELLSRKHHCIETAYRKLISFASTMMMKRVREMLEENGTERYNHFVKENRPLLSRISLGDLACYLGISQVSLSRIRGKR
ncbi:MAG: Crp/Fnr family transcriptional regulator [Allomuricauda sp.]